MVGDAVKKTPNNRIVRISQRAYDSIVRHATTYASSKIPQAEWRIVYGFLIGRLHGKELVISEAVPMTHGTNTSVEFTPEDYINTASIGLELSNQGYFLVGWYHSHPGKGLFLHEVDLFNHLKYQGVNPAAIALVIDHALIIAESRGLEIFSIDDTDVCFAPGNIEIPKYHAVKWEIDLELDNGGITGPTINKLRKKEIQSE